MAIEKTVKLNVETTAAQQALDKFGGTLEDLHGEGVQPLNFAIGELEDRLYEMAAAGQAGTQEFNDMAAEVGRMKKVIIDTDLAVDGFSQNMAQNVSGATAGIASGFELAQGSMAAFGASGEAVEESLLKVQSAMAISQGLQGLKESVASFQALGASIKKASIVQRIMTSTTWLGVVAQKALNLAMNANPIGVMIVAITALIGAITYFTSAASDAAEVNDRLTDSYDRQRDAVDLLTNKVKKSADQRIELLEAQGASEETLHNERLNRLKIEEEARKINVQFEKAFIEDKRKAYKRAAAQGKDDLARDIKEEIAQSKARYNELEAQNKDYHHNVTVENTKFEKEQAEERKRAWEEYKAQLQEREDNEIAYIRRLTDIKISTITDEAEKEKATRLEAQRRTFEDLENDETLSLEKKQELRRALEFKFRQENAEDDRLFLEFRKAEIDTYQERELETYRTYEAEKVKIGIHNRKEDLENFISNQEAKADIASSGFAALSELATAFAGESEAEQKKAFKINKIAGIAQATIDTTVGASKAFVSQLVPADPTSVIRAGLAAAFATASGIARIATIAKTKFQGGGSPSSSAGGGTPNLGSSNPAEFNIVGNTGNNQLAESLGGQEQVVQAYVVAGEVTTAQSLERNKIETATL